MKLLIFPCNTVDKVHNVKFIKTYIDKYFKNKSKIEYILFNYHKNIELCNDIMNILKDGGLQNISISTPTELDCMKCIEKDLNRLLSKIDSILFITEPTCPLSKVIIKSHYNKIKRSTILISIIKRYNNTYIDLEVEYIWKDIERIQFDPGKKIKSFVKMKKRDRLKNGDNIDE